MRSMVLLGALCLLLTTLPPASAEAAPPACPAQDVPSGTVTVAVRDDCTAEVGVLDNAYCLYGGGPVERDVAGNTVRVLVCDPGLGDLIRPAAASSHCPDDVYVGGGIGLYFRDDCSADPHAEVSWACLGGGGRTKTVYDRENVSVSVTVCDGPDPGDPALSAASSTAMRPCPEAGNPTARIDQYCDVYVRLVNCPWGGRYREVATVSSFTVYNYECGPIGPPPQPASSGVQYLPVCPDHAVGLGAAGEAGYEGCELYVHALHPQKVCQRVGFYEYQAPIYDEGRVEVTYGTCRPYIYEQATSQAIPLPPVGCFSGGVPAPVDGVVDVEGSLSQCTVTVTVGGGLCGDDPGNYRTVQEGRLIVRVATCYLSGGKVPDLCDYLKNTACGGIEFQAAPSCNGVWYLQRTVGPVTVYTDGSRECTGAYVDPR